MPWNVPVFDATGKIKDARVGGSTLTASGTASVVAASASASATVGGVINASSASQADVETAIAAASPGDTVQVPAGTATWTDLALSKGIHLVGAGSGNTGSDTVITLGASNTITKQAAAITYIRSFRFVKSSGGNASHGWTINGNWTDEPIVIEDCVHDITTSGLYTINDVGGVIWAKCEFYGLWDDSFIRPKDTTDTASWTTDSTFGADDTDGKLNFYVEDCYFYGGTNQGTDFDDGARAVFRYNRCDYTSFNSHGLATSEVGCRHFEIYGNKFYNNTAGGWTGSENITDISNQNWAIWIRGGTGFIYSNEIDDIANSFWGTGKSEVQLHVRAAHDNSGAAYGSQSPPTATYSSGCGLYPRERQIGQSWDESLNGGAGDYFTDPIRIYSNTGAGTTNGIPNDISVSNGGWSVTCDTGTYGTPASFVQEDRDYILGTAKPGYTAYTYPHPLRQTTGQAY